MENTAFATHVLHGCGISAEYGWVWTDTGVQIPVCGPCLGHRLGLMLQGIGPDSEFTIDLL